jgi:RNA recognition motif-containing protein
MVKTLYIGNLSYDATEDELRQHFAQHGEVKSVKIVTDRDTGRPRGFGFVEMENADKAMDELNGKEFKGRNLRVNEARPTAQKKDFGGGRKYQDKGKW